MMKNYTGIIETSIIHGKFMGNCFLSDFYFCVFRDVCVPKKLAVFLPV